MIETEERDCEFTKTYPWDHPIAWLFNLRPYSDCRPLTDKKGRRYWLLVRGEMETFTNLDVYHRGSKVAKILLSEFEEGRICISDICIAVKYRQCGIGGQLISLVKGIARRRGATLLYGYLVEKDIRAFPGLADWYAKHGFTMEELSNRPEDAPGETKAIVRYDCGG